MDEPQKALASLQNIEDALVILTLDRLLSDQCLETDPELKGLALDSVKARLVRLLGVKEG